jgi:enoyl-CoA hydratase/carnithine racemase
LTYQYIDFAADGVVATLALNRPPLNIMHIEMLEEINSALLDLRNEPSLKVLVIRGRGKAFSGGSIQPTTPLRSCPGRYTYFTVCSRR